MLHNGIEVPSHIYMERDGVYKVDFTPEGSGSYNVNVYYNDEEVRGTVIFIYILREKSLAIIYNGFSHRRYFKH